MSDSYAVQDADGSIKGSRVHAYQDCRSLKPNTKLVTVNEREIGLLGLKPCTRCTRRAEGSPGLYALSDILVGVLKTAEDEIAEDVAEPNARYILDELAKQGYYIAARGTRKSGIKDAN